MRLGRLLGDILDVQREDARADFERCVEIEASSRSFDEAGRVGVISVLRDVTKRKAEASAPFRTAAEICFFIIKNIKR